MATVNCILKYKNKRLTKTYQVTFDANDTIKVVTQTPGLVIKADNKRARDLFPALKNGSAGGGQNNPQVAAAAKSDYEFTPELVLQQAVASGPNSQFRFSAGRGQVAKFLCGYRNQNGTFESYKDLGPEFP